MFLQMVMIRGCYLVVSSVCRGNQKTGKLGKRLRGRGTASSVLDLELLVGIGGAWRLSEMYLLGLPGRRCDDVIVVGAFSQSVIKNVMIARRWCSQWVVRRAGCRGKVESIENVNCQSTARQQQSFETGGAKAAASKWKQAHCGRGLDKETVLDG